MNNKCDAKLQWNWDLNYTAHQRPYCHREMTVEWSVGAPVEGNWIFNRSCAIPVMGWFITEIVRWLLLLGRVDGVVVIHLALHQWVRGSIPATGCIVCKWFPNPYLLSQVFSRDLRFSSCFQNWCVCVIYIKNTPSPRGIGELCLKSGCYNLSADRIVAPYGMHAYMKRHDSDVSPVAAKLQLFRSFRRKVLYKYGYSFI